MNLTTAADHKLISFNRNPTSAESFKTVCVGKESERK